MILITRNELAQLRDNCVIQPDSFARRSSLCLGVQNLDSVLDSVSATV